MSTYCRGADDRFRPIADVEYCSHTQQMRPYVAGIVALSAALTGCSYEYAVQAVAQDGRVIFVVDSGSGRRPSCFRFIEVSADQDRNIPYWREHVSLDDDCANRFPYPYGMELKGRHEPDEFMTTPKPLQREVVYVVNTTTGTGGYGQGRFIIHSDGRIENVVRQASN